MEEKQLLNKIKKGDRTAFEYLYSEYYAGLVVFASRLLSDNDLARDTVQGVFVQLYEKRNEINIHTSFKAHLFQSVKNRCLNIFKSNQVHRLHHERIKSESSLEVFIEDQLEQTELESRIYKEVKKLPEQCRKIFEMSRFEGITNAEIAEILDISKRTVETQISKALRKLREDLADVMPLIFFILAVFG